MKTSYKIEEASDIIENIWSEADLSTVIQMHEGHGSQVFRFDAKDSQKFVFRIRDNAKDLAADKYIYDTASADLLVPEFIASGQISANSYYAITKFTDGLTLGMLSAEDFASSLQDVCKSLLATFKVDISETNGYGPIDFDTGNAQSQSWQDSLRNELIALDPRKLYSYAVAIGLEADIVDRLIIQLEMNLPYVSEVRRLLHGDPGGDNIIVKEGRVVALLDWEQAAYGDWVRDFSRFEYWNQHNYGDMVTFGKEFGLETEHLAQRKVAYWAMHTLRNIEFAGSQSNLKVANWLKANIERVLM